KRWAAAGRREREVQLRRQPADDARDALARAAGVRPAQRAVAGVEEQVGQLARRGRAQAGPELRAARITRAGEERFDAAHDGFAARAVQVAVVAVELGRAGDAQAITQAGEDELVFVVRERDL